MNITLCSTFRNSTSYLADYFNQILALDYELHKRKDKLTLLWGEGDSTDGTQAQLEAAKWRFKATLVDVSHGGPEFGSVVDSERFTQLAHVGNTMLDAYRKKESDVLLWVESDLIWAPDTMLTLIDHLDKYPAVAPLVLLDRPGWPKGSFYDTWGFRKDGKHFTHRRPYHKANDGHSLLQIDSAGSCMAVRGEMAKELHFPEEDVFVGFSKQIYEHGGTLWLDPTVSVTHL